jgi:hypothetical protein
MNLESFEADPYGSPLFFLSASRTNRPSAERYSEMPRKIVQKPETTLSHLTGQSTLICEDEAPLSNSLIFNALRL